jgi:hypothetical protein
MFGLLAAASVALSQAQELTDISVARFDTTNDQFSALYLWWGVTNFSCQWDGTQNSAPAWGFQNTPGSGALLCTVDWTGTSSKAPGGLQPQVMLMSGFTGQWWSDYTINGFYYDLNFDLKFDPASATTAGGDYGHIQAGVLVDRTTMVPCWDCPAFNSNGWAHIHAYIDPAVPGICLIDGFYLFWPWQVAADGSGAGAIQGVQRFWVDNIIFNTNLAKNIKPPALALAPDQETPGLRLTTFGAAVNDRNSIGVSDIEETWVGYDQTTPVTYSFTIAQYPGTNAWNLQTHLFLVPQAGAESAPDWNETNCVFLRVKNKQDGSAEARFMYKINDPNDNTMLWNTQPGGVYGTNGYPAGTLAVLTDPNGIVGTWSLSFLHDTNITLTSPTGLTTDFSFPNVAVITNGFATNVCALFGVQPLGSQVLDQQAVISNIRITGTPNPVDETFTAPTLDLSVWTVRADVPNSVFPVESNIVFSLLWTLPDFGFDLQAAPNLYGPWQDPGLGNTIVSGPIKWVFVPKRVLPSANRGFFRMGKGLAAKLQVLMPGETSQPGTPSGKAGTPDPQLVGSPFVVTVNACDADWNLVVDCRDPVRLTSTDGNFQGAVTGNQGNLANGAGQFMVTFGTAGNQTITATDTTPGAVVPTPNTGSPTPAYGLTLVVLMPEQTYFFSPWLGLVVEGSPDRQQVGAPFAVTVVACDFEGNPLTNCADTVQLTSSDSQAVLGANAPLVNGTATFNVIFNTLGSQTITASDVTAGAGAAAPSTGSPTPVVAPYLRVAMPYGAVGGGVSYFPQTVAVPFSVTVSVFAITGYVFSNNLDTVHLTSSDSAAILPADAPLVNGSRTFTGVIFNTPGTQTITASDVTDSSVVPSTGQPTTVAAPLHLLVLMPGETFAAGFGRRGAPNSQIVEVPFTVTVLALGTNWNVLSNCTDTVRFASSDSAAVLPADASLVNGTLVFTNVSFQTPGSQTISASDVTSGAVAPNTGSPTPVVAPYLQVAMPYGGVPQTVGVPFSVTVSARDSITGHVLSNNLDTVHLTSSDSAAILPADAPLVNGSRTFTGVIFNTPGTQTITASDVTDSSVVPGTGQPTTVAAPLHLLVLMPGETFASGFGRMGAPNSQIVEVPFTVTVLALGTNWNVLSNCTDTVRFASSDSAAVLPADAPLVNGRLVFTNVSLQTLGSQTISASDVTSGAVAPDTGSPVTVLASTYLLVLMPGQDYYPSSGVCYSPNAQRVGVPFPVTVLACDPQGNPLTKCADTVHLASSDSQASLPGNAPLVSGVATFSVVFNSPGSQTITASDVTSATVASYTGSPTVVSPFSQLQVLMPGETSAPGTHGGKLGAPMPQEAGLPFNVIVNACDANWNVLTDCTDMVYQTSSDYFANVLADGQWTSLSSPSPTLVNGTCTYLIVFGSTGIQTFTAYDQTDGAVPPATGSPTMVAP